MQAELERHVVKTLCAQAGAQLWDEAGEATIRAYEPFGEEGGEDGEEEGGEGSEEDLLRLAESSA